MWFGEGKLIRGSGGNIFGFFCGIRNVIFICFFVNYLFLGTYMNFICLKYFFYFFSNVYVFKLCDFIGLIFLNFVLVV